MSYKDDWEYWLGKHLESCEQCKFIEDQPSLAPDEKLEFQIAHFDDQIE